MLGGDLLEAVLPSVPTVGLVSRDWAAALQAATRGADAARSADISSIPATGATLEWAAGSVARLAWAESVGLCHPITAVLEAAARAGSRDVVGRIGAASPDFYNIVEHLISIAARFNHVDLVRDLMVGGPTRRLRDGGPRVRQWAETAGLELIDPARDWRQLTVGARMLDWPALASADFPRLAADMAREVGDGPPVEVRCRRTFTNLTPMPRNMSWVRDIRSTGRVSASIGAASVPVDRRSAFWVPGYHFSHAYFVSQGPTTIEFTVGVAMPDQEREFVVCEDDTLCCRDGICGRPILFDLACTGPEPGAIARAAVGPPIPPRLWGVDVCCVPVTAATLMATDRVHIWCVEPLPPLLDLCLLACTVRRSPPHGHLGQESGGVVATGTLEAGPLCFDFLLAADAAVTRDGVELVPPCLCLGATLEAPAQVTVGMFDLDNHRQFKV